MKHCWLTCLMALLLILPAWGASPGYQPMENPVGPQSWWWNNAWWEEGELPVPINHRVETRWIEYPNGDVSVPAMIAHPADGKKYPAVLYQHGRRGLDELIQAQVRRLPALMFCWR